MWHKQRGIVVDPIWGERLVNIQRYILKRLLQKVNRLVNTKRYILKQVVQIVVQNFRRRKLQLMLVMISRIQTITLLYMLLKELIWQVLTTVDSLYELQYGFVETICQTFFLQVRCTWSVSMTLHPLLITILCVVYYCQTNYLNNFQSTSSVSEPGTRPSSHCRAKSSPDPLGLLSHVGEFLFKRDW